ncbi:MAG: hypothetical protein ABFC21_08495 [Rectinema sp.]|jgi:predicted heme/steroid binding protein
MKKVFAILAIFLVFLAGCSIFSSQAPEVKEYSASSLKKSGATNVPTKEEEILNAFASAENMETDPFLMDLEELFNSLESKGSSKEKGIEKARSIGERALSAAKDLVDSLTTQIEDISEAIDDFPTTKKLNEKINVNGENIGTYLTFTKGEATLKADAKTTDNQAIAQDASNLKEVTGDASIKIEINPTNALYSAGSAIKDLKLKTNAAGNAKITIKDSEIDKLTLEYSNSLAFGLSINMDGNGGKFVIKEDIDFSKTISGADLTEAMDSEDPEALTSLLEPKITISLKVYNDNNQVKFSKTYNSIEDFTTAFTPEEPTE